MRVAIEEIFLGSRVVRIRGENSCVFDTLIGIDEVFLSGMCMNVAVDK